MNNAIWYYNPYMQKYYYTNNVQPTIITQNIITYPTYPVLTDEIIQTEPNSDSNSDSDSVQTIEMIVEQVNEMTQTEHSEPAIIQTSELTQTENENENDLTQTNTDFNLINISFTEPIVIIDNYEHINENENENQILHTNVANKYYNTIDICLSIILIVLLII